MTHAQFKMRKEIIWHVRFSIRKPFSFLTFYTFLIAIGHCLCFSMMWCKSYLQDDQICWVLLYLHAERWLTNIWLFSNCSLNFFDLVSNIGWWRCLFNMKILMPMVYQVKSFYSFFTSSLPKACDIGVLYKKDSIHLYMIGSFYSHFLFSSFLG